MRLGPGLVALGITTLVGCVDAPDRTISVQSDDGRPRSCEAEILEEDFLPDAEGILAVAADSSIQHGAWALVLDDPEPEDPGQRVFLTRYSPGGVAEVDPIDLGFVQQPDEELRLWAGADPGRAYLLREGPNKADVWVVDAGVGLVAAGSLSNIPGLGAINDWDRHVVFMQGRPYVVAVPSVSTTLSLSFYAAELDDNLVSATVWELPFIHPCETDNPPPAEVCAAELLTRTELRVGSTNPIPGGYDTTVLLEKLRIIEEPPFFEVRADVSLLKLSLESGSPSASLLTIPNHVASIAQDNPPIAPLELTFDPYRAWVRADDILYAVDLLYPSAFRYEAPFGFRGTLAQLPQTGVASEIDDGTWWVAPFDGDPATNDGVFPDYPVLGAGPDDRVQTVESAGIGHFLVRREDDDRTAYVYLGCTDFEQQP